MHINGILITKEFISHWISKWLRGSVIRAHIHIGYIFLKSNEEIVVRNPKSKIFFVIYSFCLVCVWFYNLYVFSTTRYCLNNRKQNR